ncbi:MAG: hypothetical protein U9R47_08220, partial [Actinomycetota bacterium]|nr:hypothetical protein [Actinomycetota bacterium]
MPTDTQPSNEQSTKKRKRLFIVAGLVGLIVVIGVAALVWYLNQPVPEEVSIEAAVGDVATTESTTPTDSTAPLGGLG